MRTPPACGEDTPADTIARFRRSDPRAFEAVFDATSPAAFALARRICGSVALADDAMQNAYLDVWRRAPSYDPARGTVAAWVMCIVRHRSIDTVRRSTVHERRRASDLYLVDTPAPDRAVVDEVLDGDQRRRMHAAVATLPTDQRAVIELAYDGDLSQTEIAEQLSLPLGTVKSRVRLGLGKLRYGMDPAERPRASRSG